MADIKRFTGFIAPDGTTHDTIKKATEHTNALKVKDALQKCFNDSTINFSMPGVTFGEIDTKAILAEDMAVFLFANKEAIELCFAEKALLRAPRKVKVKVPTMSMSALTSGAAGKSVLAQSEAKAAGLIDLDD